VVDIRGSQEGRGKKALNDYLWKTLVIN
jgi:hypothetical protein